MPPVSRYEIVLVVRGRGPVDRLPRDHPGELRRGLDDVVNEVGQGPVRAGGGSPKITLADGAKQRLELVEPPSENFGRGVVTHDPTQPDFPLAGNDSGLDS